MFILTLVDGQVRSGGGAEILDGIGTCIRFTTMFSRSRPV